LKPYRITIVGAGVSGLACAERLLDLSRGKNLPLEIKILDGASHAGGVLGTLEKEGFLLEEGADCFITDKPAALDLAQKLGLEQDFIRTNPKLKQSFILKNNRLHPIPDGFYLLAPSRFRPLVLSPLLSPWGKLRAAVEPWIPKRRDPQDESVGDFVRRRLGKEVFESMAQPLIGGVYNADPDDLSLSAALPRFKEMELTYGSIRRGLAFRPAPAQTSGARYSLFVSFKKGMGSFTKALSEQLPAESLSLGNSVRSVKHPMDGIWELEAEDGKFETDALVLALPPHQMRPLIGHLDTEWDKLLGGIPAHDSATLNLGFSRDEIGHPLDGFGFVVPAKEKKSILGCTFASQKFEGRAPEGMVLLRAFLGAATAESIKSQGEEAVVKQVLDELTPILQLKSKPRMTHLAFYSKAMSHFRPGHLSQAARLEQKATEFKGLYLAGNGFKGVGIPDCVASGQAAAENIFKDLDQQPR
jgi:protoporphyrinogen/coproporphyrinogen III oxidase